MFFSRMVCFLKSKIVLKDLMSSYERQKTSCFHQIIVLPILPNQSRKEAKMAKQNRQGNSMLPTNYSYEYPENIVIKYARNSAHFNSVFQKFHLYQP